MKFKIDEKTDIIMRNTKISWILVLQFYQEQTF